mmetsp:Transcript_55289/g.134296  ORF Transcript_55289/g.134296 Transcript_55289/m.134296 type:complete len:287 (+) Transcript_55289:96-956(+)
MTTATTDDTLFAVMGSTDFSDLGDFLGEAFDDVSPDPVLSVLPASSAESESESHILMDRDRVSVSPEIATSDIQVQHPALTLAPELTARISPTPKSVPIVGESSSDEADDVVSSPSVSSTNKTKIKPPTSTTTSAKRSRTSSSASTKKAGSSGPSSSSASSSSSSSVCSDDSNGGGADDDVLKKKIRRRERNREHAKKCRSRKKNYLKTLEESVVDLRRDNDKLRRLVLTKFTKDEVATLLKQDPAMASALKTSGVATTTVAATATSPPTTVVTSTDTSSTSSLTL